MALRSRAEYFGHPDIEEIKLKKKILARRAGECTESLDADGLPVIGSWVRQGSILVGRISALETQESTTRGSSGTTAPRPLQGQQAAIVDDVSISSKIVKVRLRILEPRRWGQVHQSLRAKGTVGKVVSEEDLPFVVSGPDGMHGIRPDLIMNPQAVPSRMTIGQLIESACSLAAMATGQRVDGSPWSDAERSAKVRQWAEEAQKVRMADGATGRVLERPVSMGFVQYFRLKHMVSDKCHARADGPTQPLTQQPAEGRSRDGGLRIGEMENAQLWSHGAGACAREATTTRSDPTTIYVCKSCRRQCETSRRTLEETVRAIQAGEEDSGMRCNWCGSSDVVAVGSNYVTKLLNEEIKAMGMVATFGVRTN